MDDNNYIAVYILIPVTTFVILGSIIYIKKEWNKLKLQMIQSGQLQFVNTVPIVIPLHTMQMMQSTEIRSPDGYGAPPPYAP